MANRREVEGERKRKQRDRLSIHRLLHENRHKWGEENKSDEVNMKKKWKMAKIKETNIEESIKIAIKV